MSSLLPPVDQAVIAAPSRRTVVGAGLWSVPVLAASSAVPAYATTSGANVITISTQSGVIPSAGSTALSVKVATSAGSPAAGQAISLSAPTGATLWATDGVTDSSGTFSTRVDLGSPWAKPGSTVTFSAVAGGEASSQSFTVVGANVVVAGNNSQGQLGLGAVSTPVSTAVQTAPVFPSPVVDIRASGFLPGGGLFALALLADGSVWSTGGNGYGQLGDGTTAARATWSRVLGLPKIASVAALRGNSYAIDVSGDVWSWGEAKYGQLGEPVGSDRSTPAKVPNLSGVRLIRGANAARLVQKTDGTWWGFGWNGTGLLANGDSATQTTPIRITALDGFTDVSDGFGYGFVGLKADGTVWAWGSNKNGQLCDGTTTSSPTPKKIPGLSGITAVTASQGSDYEYSTGYALASDGTVWGWGRNDSEQIDSSKTDLTVPVQVTTGALQIVASQANLFALKTDGSVWTRGAALDYRSGATSGTTLSMPRTVGTLRAATTAFGATALYGLVVDQSVTLDVVDAQVPAGQGSAVKVSVKAGTAGVPGVAVTLSATANATLGAVSGTTDVNGTFSTTATPDPWTKAGTTVTVSLASDSGLAQDSFVVLGANVLVAGNNAGGQLGTGSTSAPVSSLRQAAAVFPHPVIDIRASGLPSGQNMFALALLSDGSLWSVGQNGSGQLGDGTTTNRATWAKVSGLPEIESISALSGNTYAVARNGDLWAWGEGRYSLLGEPSASNRKNPAAVTGLTNVRRVFGASSTSRIAQKTDGTWWAWGWNGNGLLASGTTTDVTTPTRVTALDGFTDLTDGFGYGFAGLKADGSVWAWGGNSHGQLCDGTTASSSAPKRIPGLSGITQLVAATGEAYENATGYALKNDGTVWAWGKNDRSQIDSSGTDLTSPVQIDTGAVQIAASQGNVFILKNDGTLWMRGKSLDYRAGGVGMTAVPLPRTAAALRAAATAYGGADSLYVLTADEQIALDIPATSIKAGAYTALSAKVSAGSKAVAGATVALASPNLADFEMTTGVTNADGTFSTTVAADPWTAPGTLLRVTAASGPSTAVDTVKVFGANLLENTPEFTQSERAFPTPVVSAVSLHGADAVLLEDGTVWTRGDAVMLGDGSTVSRASWGIVPSLSGVTKLAGGVGGGSVFRAVTSSGQLWGWGANGYGQLNDGTTTSRGTPVRFQGISDAIDVSCANGAAFVLRADKTVWSVGWNDRGTAGVGTVTNPSPLAQVAGASDVSAVFGRPNGGYLLKTDGSLWGWGTGDLIDGGSSDYLSPVRMALSGVSRLTFGFGVVGWSKVSVFAIMSDGTVRAWGNNDDGQLGDNSKTSRWTDAPVLGLTSVRDVLPSGGAVIALRTDGSVVAWGATQFAGVGTSLTPKTVPVSPSPRQLASRALTTYSANFLAITDTYRPATRSVANLALFAPVKVNFEHPSYKATNATDGSATTRWVGAASDPNWIVVDLGAEHRVNRVELRWEVQSAVDFSLGFATTDSAWNDPTTTSWNTVYDKTGATPGTRNDSITFGVVSGRYMRLYIGKRSYQYGPGLFEISAYRD